ncbi:MAG: hypothetical protein ACOYLS_01190 [Polymorphobacter sp.]
MVRSPFCCWETIMRLILVAALFAVALFTVAMPASAATPDAIAQGLTEAKAACRKASDLKNAATLGKPVIFSDAAGKTAVLVTGIWRPKHMNNARAVMLCLYDRAGRTTEVQEAKTWTAGSK